MHRNRHAGRGASSCRLIGIFLCLLAMLPASGCSLGFKNLHPGEESGLYYPLFADVITSYDEPHWLWIRGVITGDFDGDGKVEEEAVIATIQKGDPAHPGPIESALLVICRPDPANNRVAMARTLLFKGDPFAGAPHTTNDLGIPETQPLTRVRAQIIQDKLRLNESVVVYFWGDRVPFAAWYAGYDLKDGILRKILETSMWQSAPGVLMANLDKSLEGNRLGYQLLFGVAAIPDEIAQKLGKVADAPLWGHTFSKDENGIYRQADAQFGMHYKQLENDWNQYYLKAVLHGLSHEELAWFEYHMGIMNHFTENPEMSSQFLEKAKRYSSDARLTQAIERAQEYIAGATQGGTLPVTPKEAGGEGGQ